MKQPDKVGMTIKMEKPLHESVRKMAFKERRSIASLIRDLLVIGMKYYERYDSQKDHIK